MSLRAERPKIADRIEQVWGTGFCDSYLSALLRKRNTDHIAPFLSQSAYDEIQIMLDLHRVLD